MWGLDCQVLLFGVCAGDFPSKSVMYVQRQGETSSGPERRARFALLVFSLLISRVPRRERFMEALTARFLPGQNSGHEAALQSDRSSQVS